MKTLVIPDINALEFLIRKTRNETMITLQNYTSEEIDLFSVHSIIKSGDFYFQQVLFYWKCHRNGKM